ncbi:MAG TPA: zf-TFIIB domain-containing protein [Anaerolineales bacterium]|nr:zf-TFIIB domain-containing protein [Anaerolineales bacterium]
MKKCPVCKNEFLNEITLEDGLPAHQCGRCSGIWISSNPYLAWLKTHGPDLPEKEQDGSNAAAWDVKELKLCPDCGRIMSRYKVLPNVQLYLDRCGNCNGIWFDKEEWNVLVARNLHDNVNSFFTKPWQAHIHEEETKAVMDKLYLEKFGPEDYARLKEIREWLKDHPHRSTLLAYLQADNPYKN